MCDNTCSRVLREDDVFPAVSCWVAANKVQGRCFQFEEILLFGYVREQELCPV